MTEWIAVITITLLAVISPGPDFAMVTRNSLLLSRRAGVGTALGIALGVAALIIVLSVMNGFQKEMSSRILGMVPHAMLYGAEPVADWRALADKAMANPQVQAAAPYAELEGMLSHRGTMQPIREMNSSR